MTMLDLICPIYHVDWDVFTYCVDSWIREFPCSRWWIGLANPNENEYNAIKNYLEQKNNNIVIFNHVHYKTLGKSISELISYVETSWFIYVHSDAEATPMCWNILESWMSNDDPLYGIIESERIHSDKQQYTYDPYHFSSRAYSGLQVMYKDAVNVPIDDDYVYRNEDMIYQNICQQQGYEYCKSWAMHVHYLTTTKKWTHEREETYDMQWKGLVKYTTPTDITIQAVLDALHVCLNEFNHDIVDVIEIADHLDPSRKWKRSILNRLFKK